jgi:hypothetical protein
MKWYTLIHGLLLLGIGLAARYWFQLLQWQALVPIALGLGYITFAEGMRSKPNAKRTFIFLSLLWSIVIVVITLPIAREVLNLWNNQPVQLEGVPLKSELVIEHAVVLGATLLFMLIAVRSLFLKTNIRH